MDCEEGNVSAPTEKTEIKKKSYKDKSFDLKYLKKKLPYYVNLTKNSDLNDVRRGLIGIKTLLMSGSDWENILNVFQLCSGLKQLIKLLSSSNDQRQLGMVLCIVHLAWNKINQTSWRTEILTSGLVSNLADILVKSSDVNNQSRSLKLICTLSHHQGSSKEFISCAVGKAIVVLMAQTKHTNIHLTAIKTLRRMWSADKNHGKLLECGAVKAVATFLPTKDSQLLGCVLKALVVFTDPCTISASQQVIGVGDGYQLIVSKVGSKVVSELICNLSRSPVGRIELTRAGLVPEIIRQISCNKYDKYLIMALCQMCQESMVRASLRATPSGFETFLSLITNKAAEQYHSDLLYALTYFIYDTQSLTMMVRAGLVDVLIEKLSDVSHSMGSLHIETPPIEPIPLPIPPSTYTHCSTPTHTPATPNNSETSPIYHPSSPTYTYTSFDNLTLLSPSELGICNKKKRKESEMSCSKSQDSCILEVLLQLTYHHTKLKTLALKDTIDTILRYMTTVDFSRQESNFLRATKTLRAIVSCKHHFNKLLDEKTIMSIHRELCVRRHWNCTYCDRLYLSGQVILTEMAESSESALGEGEMAHRLTSGTSLMKTTVALTIPLIIKQPQLLYSLLLIHRGLDCLIKALDSHIDDAVPALYSLMKTVGINNPQQHSIECCPDESVVEYNNGCEDSTKEDIRFELDDGSAVLASKSKLAKNYPMFEAMFRGGFKEAGAETVKLPGVSQACLKALVNLDSLKPSHSTLPSSVSTLLEMISASDRFLSPDLSENLISHIIHRVLSSETSPEIYSWSVNTGYKLPFSSTMSITTISYLFTANMFFKDRVEAVKTIIESPERENLFNDLNSIILSGMQDYSEKINRHARLSWNSFCNYVPISPPSVY